MAHPARERNREPGRAYELEQAAAGCDVGDEGRELVRVGVEEALPKQRRHGVLGEGVFAERPKEPLPTLAARRPVVKRPRWRELHEATHGARKGLNGEARSATEDHVGEVGACVGHAGRARRVLRQRVTRSPIPARLRIGKRRPPCGRLAAPTLVLLPGLVTTVAVHGPSGFEVKEGCFLCVLWVGRELNPQRRKGRVLRTRAANRYLPPTRAMTNSTPNEQRKPGDSHTMPTRGTHRVAAGLAPCAIQLPTRGRKRARTPGTSSAPTPFSSPVPVTGFPSMGQDGRTRTCALWLPEPALLPD